MSKFTVIESLQEYLAEHGFLDMEYEGWRYLSEDVDMTFTDCVKAWGEINEKDIDVDVDEVVVAGSDEIIVAVAIARRYARVISIAFRVLN